MKTYRHITAYLALLGFLLGSAPAYLYAAPADGDTKSRSATLLCGGAHRVEDDGIVRKSSSWSFRNYNDSDSIRVDRIRIYDGNGILLHYAEPPPASGNGVDPSNVGPHSTIVFGSNFLLELQPKPKAPLQFVLDWSSKYGKKVRTLDGYVVRRDALTSGEPAGIFTFDCRTINANNNDDDSDSDSDSDSD